MVPIILRYCIAMPFRRDTGAHDDVRYIALT